MSTEIPTDCQICGCKALDENKCEHLIPPKEQKKPLEGKILYCPACPYLEQRYKKWYQFFTRWHYQSIAKVSAKTPMINTEENSYTCVFCGYSYRS